MNGKSEAEGAVGYLIVQVTTANTAIPLSDATVTIRGTGKGEGDALFVLKSGRDGRTPQVALPTEPRAETEAPQEALPYRVYEIEVSRNGYEGAVFEGVPVFDGIIGYQQANLAPLPANEYENSDNAVSENAPRVYRGGDMGL